ncbi:MAG: metal-dependent transcriptional regulator [Anaerolineae bacterium]
MSNSESIEMYLKTIAELGGAGESVSVGKLAERLGVTAVSANEMVKRLVRQELVQYQPYKGAILTANGRRLAHNVIRRQRLWECFLVDHLKVDWAIAYDQACDLEHATAPEVTESLAAFLNHPATCPHGNPIPDAEGDINPNQGVPLSHWPVGQTGVITAILPKTSEVLAYLNDKGIRPSQTITLTEIAPLDGPFSISINGQTVAIGRQLAELILISHNDTKTTEP